MRDRRRLQGEGLVRRGSGDGTNIEEEGFIGK